MNLAKELNLIGITSECSNFYYEHFLAGTSDLRKFHFASEHTLETECEAVSATKLVGLSLMEHLYSILFVATSDLFLHAAQLRFPHRIMCVE